MQVLITTMDLEKPEALLSSLNISTAFVIGNQTCANGIEYFEYKGNKGVVVSRSEKGVGKNRNAALSYANEDICILADDDMRFIDNYSEVIEKWFHELPDADALIFNLGNAGVHRRQNKKIVRLNRYNYMNYGAARMVFRRCAVSYNGIFFNTNFGGGTQHSAGEDVLFLSDCLKKGLRIYAVPEMIATLLDNRESTWFKGYDNKYLFDKGVFLALADKRIAFVLALYFSVRHPEYRNNKSLLQVYNEMCAGIKYITKREYISDES